MRIPTLATVVLLWALSACAQTFPLTVKAIWAPNAASEGVTSYALVVDGGAPIGVPNVTTVDPVNCPAAAHPNGCVIAPVTITAAGQHTFSVVAVNVWATSDPALATVSINKPGQVVWVKVTK